MAIQRLDLDGHAPSGLAMTMSKNDRDRTITALRGRLLSFLAAPKGAGDAASYRYIPDGVVVVEDGRITRVGPAAEMLPTLPPGTAVDHYPDELILPGFIDAHLHFPQTQVIASYGAQLLDWLQKYTFVVRAALWRPGLCRAPGAMVPGRAAGQRHHHRRGLRLGPSRLGRGLLRRIRAAGHRHDRRQGDDGPQRPARPAGHRPILL